MTQLPHEVVMLGVVKVHSGLKPNSVVNRLKNVRINSGGLSRAKMVKKLMNSAIKIILQIFMKPLYTKKRERLKKYNNSVYLKRQEI